MQAGTVLNTKSIIPHAETMQLPQPIIQRISQHRYLVKKPKGAGVGRRYVYEYWDVEKLLISTSCVFEPSLTNLISKTHADQIISMFQATLKGE